MPTNQIINDVTPWTQASASSNQTIFDTNWTAAYPADVVVYQRGMNDEPDELTQMLLESEYLVTFVGTSQVVRVTLLTPATAGDIVTITRNTAVDRLNLYTNTNFVPSMLNQDTALLTLVDQERAMLNALSVKYHISQMNPDFAATQNFPVVPLGPNQVWAINPQGTAFIAYDVPEDGSIATAMGKYILQKPHIGLPEAQALNALPTGIMVSNNGTGVVITRIIEGVEDQIVIGNPTGVNDNPIVGIAPNPIIPGTAGMGIPAGTIAERVIPTPPSIGLRYNTDLGYIEAYIQSQWVEIPSSAAGLFLPLAGGTMTGPIDMGGNEIVNVSYPVNDDDAANKIYVDNAIAAAVDDYLPLSGGTMVGDINMDGNQIQDADMIDARLVNFLDANSNKIENLAICTLGTDAANKNYVDAVAAGKYFTAPVRVSATGNFAATYNNGISGVGATLTASVNGAASIDGVTLSLNDRVIFPFQTDPIEGGIYTCTDLGSAGTPAVYTRATDYDQPSDIDPGDTIGVLEGTVYAGAFWMQTAIVLTIGTDPITFILSVNPNVVTLDTAQTITGAKTFTSPFDVIANYCTYGNNRTDATNKVFVFRIPNYNNADGDFAALVAASASGSNSVYIGGATATANAATQVQIMCAANTTTATGTSIADYNISGMRLGGANARVTTILNDATMTTAAATNLYTGAAIKGYVDGIDSPTVKRVLIRTFGTSGTYTPTAGMLYCKVECIGGGGAGGGTAAGASPGAGAGGGGGSGGYTRAIFTAVQIGASQSVTIGSGGSGVINTDGGAGSTTSVGSLISAFGGAGGNRSGVEATVVNSVQGGVGATLSAPAGGFGAPGTSGGSSFMLPPAAVATSGVGASSFIGGGAPSARASSSTLSGSIALSNTGGGGSGSATAGNAGSARAGGHGGSGLVIITEYLSA